MLRSEALKLLGLTDPWPDEMAIKIAYRKAARASHPDQGGSGFEKVNEAYQVLRKETDFDSIAEKLWKPQVIKESKLQEIVKKKLEAAGCLVFNIHGHAMQRAGIPDLYIVHRQFRGWVELKTETDLSKIQEKTIHDLIRRGDTAFVVRLRGTLIGEWDGLELGTAKWEKIQGPEILGFLSSCKSEQDKLLHR